MSRRARNRYAEATLVSLLLVGIISVSACSEDGVTPKCPEQPLYPIGEAYRSNGGSAVPDVEDSGAKRAEAANAGCMTPVGFATSSGGSGSQPTAGTSGGGAGGTAGNTNTAGLSGSAGAGNGGTSSAGNGGASAGNGGLGGLGIGGLNLAGVAGI